MEFVACFSQIVGICVCLCTWADVDDGDNDDGDGDDGNGDDGDGDGVGDSNHSTWSTETSWVAMSILESKLLQTWSLLLAKASTNSEFAIG